MLLSVTCHGFGDLPPARGEGAVFTNVIVREASHLTSVPRTATRTYAF